MYNQFLKFAYPILKAVICRVVRRRYALADFGYGGGRGTRHLCPFLPSHGLCIFRFGATRRRNLVCKVIISPLNLIQDPTHIYLSLLKFEHSKNLYCNSLSGISDFGGGSLSDSVQSCIWDRCIAKAVSPLSSLDVKKTEDFDRKLTWVFSGCEVAGALFKKIPQEINSWYWIEWRSRFGWIVWTVCVVYDFIAGVLYSHDVSELMLIYWIHISCLRVRMMMLVKGTRGCWKQSHLFSLTVTFYGSRFFSCVFVDVFEVYWFFFP